MEFEKSLLQELHKHHIDIPNIEWNTDKYIRNGASYLKARKFTLKEKPVATAIFGDWKIHGDQPIFWKSFDHKELSDDEIKEIEIENKRMREEHLKNLHERDNACKEKASSMWNASLPVGTHEYLTLKKLTGLYGAKIYTDENGHKLLLVPMKDSEGTLWNVQRIYEKTFEKGNKFVLSGRTRGLYHTIKGNDEYTLLCEGYATGASLHEATGYEVIISFNADNLVRVAEILKLKNKNVLICADNDAFKDFNKGLESAKKANTLTQYPFVLPQFTNVDSKPTDFNDLFLLEGKEVVKNLITKNAKKELKNSEKLEKQKLGISEMQVVYTLLKEEGEHLIRQGKSDIFSYDGTKWRHLEPVEAESYFKRKIDFIYQGKAKYKDIHSAWQHFLIHLDTPPQGKNLFAPDPYKVGFKNGTLHITPTLDGNFNLTLKPHHKLDFITHCHDFDYDVNAELNQEFEDAVDLVLGKDKDLGFEGARKAYHEVLGACLVAGAFRKIVFFVGPPKSGKSTLILFAYNMVHRDYTCSVDPTKMYGFNMQSMAGKLLNYDTDVRLSKPIEDSILKKVEDRLPMRIERKGINDIYAPLPGMHLFGANELPSSSEAVDAYQRRVIWFDCKHYSAPNTGYIQDYAQTVWMKNPSGIVRRAIEGLVRLCNNRGHFTEYESNKEIFEEFKRKEADPVVNFLDDLREGEVINEGTKVSITGKENDSILRSKLADIFCVWYEKNYPRSTPPDRFKFFQRLTKMGFKAHRFKHGRYILGIAISEPEDAPF